MSRKENILQFIKYSFIAASAGIIQALSFTLMEEIFRMPYWISYLTALVLSVLWNFTFNRKYTFKATNDVGHAMMLVFLFYLVFTPLSTWWGHLLDGIGVNNYVILAGTMIINLITEFLYQKYIVFKK
ncbi:MAG: GtrA family protein [Solobacterium sp.]|nr:GtrA family protein [Solobacterium sp.]